MYEIYAEKRGWRWSVVEQSENDLGGVREASVSGMQPNTGAGACVCAVPVQTRLAVFVTSCPPTPFSPLALSLVLTRWVVLVTGQNVFSALKFESGVHRVQRIPTTDSAGRIHTHVPLLGLQWM